ncbi:MAG TPA: acyl carrier protein, partial [Candidatus Omnitrophota bacterium]|nr:acyl carrier protein [Candidatus Omnitrophota bacterium]
ILKENNMSVEERVKQVFKKVLDVNESEIKADQRLDVSLGLDSTEMVEIIVVMKKEFGVAIADNEIKKTHSFNEIVGILKSKGVK